MVAFPWRWLAVAACAVAFGIRFWALDARPLWFDEGYSIYFAGVSPLEAARLTALDIHPPLYYWLLQSWTWLVGWFPVSVRAFSAFTGVLTVAAVAALGSRVVSRPAGAVAAWILAVSPFHAAYSQEVRMYALLTLATVLGLLGWWRLRGQADRASFVLCIVGLGAALLTQYFAVFLVVGLALSLIVDRTAARRRLIALAAASLTMVGWAAYSAGQLISYVQNKVAYESYAPLDPIAFLSGVFGAFGGGLLVAVAAAYGLTRLSRPARVLLLAALLPIVAGFVVNLLSPFHPFGWERIYLFVLPAVAVAAAAGLTRLPRLLVAPASVMVPLVLVGSGVLTPYRTTLETADPRPMIRTISALAQPTDRYLAVYPWQIGYLRLYAQTMPEPVLLPAQRWGNDPAALARELPELAGDRSWLPSYQRLGHLLEDEIERTLNGDRFLVAASWFEDSRLLFFGTSEGDRAVVRSGRVGSVRLTGGSVSAEAVPAGCGIAGVTLDWSAPAGAIHLRLADANGITWAQHDSDSTGPRDRRGILIPAGTPPGDYRLLLSRTEQGRVVEASTDAGTPIGTELPLPPVRVEGSCATSPDALFIERPINRDLGGVRLLGASFGAGPYQPGDRALVTLFWQADRPARDRTATLSLGTSEATVPVGGGYSVSRWEPGQPVREIRQLPVRQGGPLVLETNGQRVTLGDIRVESRPLVVDLPSVAIPIDGTIGDARLIGANVSSGDGALPPGELARTMEVELVWKADRETDDDLTVFVHLVGPDGRPVAQHDGRPVNGQAPTAGWRAGEVIRDSHRLVVPANVPAGDYRIIAGLYRSDGSRLATSTGDSVPVLAGRLP